MNSYKWFRIRRGLTQKEVAERMGVAQVSVHQWENGKSQPKLDKLPRLASLYRCSIEDLITPKEFGDNETPCEEAINHAEAKGDGEAEVLQHDRCHDSAERGPDEGD